VAVSYSLMTNGKLLTMFVAVMESYYHLWLQMNFMSHSVYFWCNWVIT